MPKDNENILVPFVGPMQPSEREGFAFEEMITCDECLRSNPPTRIACLYCGKDLPVTESTARLRRPTLIQPDKFKSGYNSIFIRHIEPSFGDKQLHDAAQYLRVTPESLQKLLSSPVPLPLAHTAREEEANLVTQRMCDLGIEARTVSDDQLGIADRFVVRIRSLQFDKASIRLRFSSSGNDMEIAYTDLFLLVQGRLIIKTTAVQERQSRTSENQILDASEFFADQPVVDIYSARHSETWRLTANNFDFSCLLDQKSLVVGENVPKLVQMIKSNAPQVDIDNHYNSVRQSLECVWGWEKETKSRGWRRNAPGKLTIEAATMQSNESQFTRYSRLTYHLRRNVLG